MPLADRISNAELEVMKILWLRNGPLSSVEIRKELRETKGWEKSTVLTLIRRLADKNVISAEKRDVLYYSPNLSEADYTQFQMQEMVDRWYQGSAKKLVAALVNGGKLSSRDIDELRQHFKMEEDSNE